MLGRSGRCGACSAGPRQRGTAWLRSSLGLVLLPLLEQVLQVLQALFKVERGVDVVEAHAQPHHREGDRRLDADDDRFRTA